MNYLLHLLTISCIYSIAAVGLNLILGLTGLPSFGQAAFASISAYGAAIASLEFGISPWLGLPLGVLISAAAGALIGSVSLRLRDDYLALATFGIGLFTASVARNWDAVTNGSLGLGGIPTLSLGGISLGTPLGFLVVSGLALLGSLGCFLCVVRSPFGRVLRAIREDEVVARTYGKNTTHYKVTIFTLGAAFAGVGGALTAYYVRYISPESFTVMDSMLMVLMVILGGTGRVLGPLVGVLVLLLAPEGLRFVGLPAGVAPWVRQLLYGLILIVLMLRRPQGLLGRVSAGPVR